MKIKIHTMLMAGMLLGGCNLTDDTNDLLLESSEPSEPGDPGAGPIDGTADELAGDNGATPYAGVPIIPQECVGAPIVGILANPEGSCDLADLPPNWAWRPMFVNGSPDAFKLGLPVPFEFQKYCMYEWVGVQPIEEIGQYGPLLTYIDSTGLIDGDTIAADCMGFKEQGDLNDPDVTKSLQEAFNLNIESLEGDDIKAWNESRGNVWLALLDSVSQDAVDNNIAAHNEHGRYMASLIGGVTCPDQDPACLADIHHLLSMPRSDYQLPDWTVGMDYASKVDVAVQIYAAVQQWREAKLGNDPRATDRLVINVSLGYNRVNAGVDEFTRGPQAALKTALEFASCHGAMVFAASGNVRDEQCPQNDTGPLAPAAFESFKAPTKTECDALGFVPDWEGDFPVFPPPGFDRPLLYAIGAVAEDGAPVVNARGDSMPQLVAHGANAVGPDMTMALTGSSVSTAVASATASLLWSYAPKLRPDEIYAAMYDSGYDINRAADFGINGPGQDIHRLSVCAALDLMCQNQDPNECPQLGCVAQPPAADGNLGGYHLAVDDVLSDPGTVIKEWYGSISAPVCSGTPLTELVVPQPELPICGNCKADIAKGAIADDDSLYMTIDPDYKGQITGGTFVITSNTGVVRVIDLDALVIDSLNDFGISVTKLMFDGPATVSATLNFDLAGGLSQANPVIVKKV